MLKACWICASCLNKQVQEKVFKKCAVVAAARNYRRGYMNIAKHSAAKETDVSPRSLRSLNPGITGHQVANNMKVMVLIIFCPLVV